MGNMFEYEESDYYSFLALAAKIRLVCFYAVFAMTGQVLRWFVWKNVPRRYQSAANDCITTFSVYGCTMANNYVYRVYGQSMHLLVMAVVGIGHALLFDRDMTTANPLTHVMPIICRRKNVMERLVTRFAGHAVGALLCHPVATAFWQLLIGDYCSRGTELVMHCVADEMSSGQPVNTTIALILEFIGTLVVCWAATSWKQQVDICEVVVKVVFGSVLLCSDMKSAGIFLNPVMSNSLLFGCQSDFGPHFVVYWLVPFVAAGFFSFVFCTATPKRKTKATCSPGSDPVPPCNSRDSQTRRTQFAADCPCPVAGSDCAAGEDTAAAVAAAACPPVSREITARVQQVDSSGGEKQLAYVFDIPPTVCQKGLRLKHNIVLSKKPKPEKRESDVDDYLDPCTGRGPRRRRLKNDQLYRGEYPDDGRYEGGCGCADQSRVPSYYPSMGLGDRKSSSLTKSSSYRSSREGSAADMAGEFDDVLMDQGRQSPGPMRYSQQATQADQILSRPSTGKRNGYRQSAHPTTDMRYSQQRASYPKRSLHPTQDTRQSYRPSEGMRQADDARQSPRTSEFGKKSYRPSDGARPSDEQLDGARPSSRTSGARKSSRPSGARESYRPSNGVRQSDGPSDDARKSSRPSGVRESYRPSNGLRQSDGPSNEAMQGSRPSGVRDSYRPSEGVRQSEGPSDDSRQISRLSEGVRESYGSPEDASQPSRQSGAKQSYRPSSDLRRNSDQSQSVQPSVDLRQSRVSSSAAGPTQRRSTESPSLQPYADLNQVNNGIPSASIPYPEQRGSQNQSSNSLIRQSRVSGLRSMAGNGPPGLESISNGLQPAVSDYGMERQTRTEPQSIQNNGSQAGMRVSGVQPAVSDYGMERPTRTEPPQREQPTQNNQNNGSQGGRRSSNHKSQPLPSSFTNVVSYYAAAGKPDRSIV